MHARMGETLTKAESETSRSTTEMDFCLSNVLVSSPICPPSTSPKYFVPQSNCTFLLHTNTQSITVPLQGFLNAIVYGWTREDFLYVMASTKNSRSLPNMDCSSDFEDTVKLVEDKLRVQQQDTPDTSMEI